MNESLWHKRFITFRWCHPMFWWQEVWARKIDGKWQYQKTQEALDLDEKMREW
jgi:hypothetical protein